MAVFPDIMRDHVQLEANRVLFSVVLLPIDLESSPLTAGQSTAGEDMVSAQKIMCGPLAGFSQRFPVSSYVCKSRGGLSVDEGPILLFFFLRHRPEVQVSS